MRESCPSKAIDPATLSTVGVPSGERQAGRGQLMGQIPECLPDYPMPDTVFGHAEPGW